MDAIRAGLEGRVIRPALRGAEQDAVLRDMETIPRPASRRLFDLLQPRATHTIQGTFGDPYYGGNANFVGWDLIGYPGVRLAVRRTISASTRDLPHAPVGVRPRDVLEEEAGAREAWGNIAIMAIDLTRTDVVIVGLGAAGGVAALPLAQAGLEVIGLEAGTWLSARRLCPRRAPEQRPRLAAGRPESESGDPDSSAERVGAVLAAAGDSSDDERGRRHHASLLGAELAPQSRGTSRW